MVISSRKELHDGSLLAHDLSEKRQASTTLLHFPSFAIDVKNAIGFRLGRRNRRSGEKAEILILDDIGAEQMSAWVRDEILQVILQHRMQGKSPNLLYLTLILKSWNVISRVSRNGDETWQAKRVMERVKF